MKSFGFRTLRAAGVVALLAVYWLAAVSSSREKSATFDELPHLAAGYSYWLTGDFRLNPENGLLPQAWAALPLRFGSFAYPSLDQASWRDSDKWSLGAEWFYGSGNDPDAMLLRGRMMIALLGVALGGIVYAWSRRLFGVRGGMISLVLYAFSPTMLAHGGLVTSDMAAAAGLMAAVWSIDSLLLKIRPRTVLAGALALAALAISKMSAALILPIVVLLVAVRLAARRPLTVVTTEKRIVRGVAPQAAWIGVALAVQLLVVCALLWASFGFRYSAFAEPRSGDRLPIPWSSLLREVGFAAPAIEIARKHHLLPEAYLYGAAHVAGLSRRGQSAFLNGRHDDDGFWYFFPYCLLVKTPLPLFALLALAAAAAWRRPREPGIEAGVGWRTAPLWILLAVYWTASILAPLNIGHRHLLPTYPAMFVLAGATAGWTRPRHTRTAWVIWACLALLVVQSVRAWPNHLSYFNALAGGSRHGYRHLVDSSLDWGQDLPALKRWLDRESPREPAGTPVYLSYFGSGSPEHYGIDALWLPSVLRIEGGRIRRGAAPVSLRGGIYCISATMLQSVYGPVTGPWTSGKDESLQRTQAEIVRLSEEDEPDRARVARVYAQLDGLRLAKLCAFLRGREPDARAGHSILIYRLSDADVGSALSSRR